MTFWNAFVTYLYVALGIAISLLMPILKQSIHRAGAGPAGLGGFVARFIRVAEPYLVIVVFSLLGAILIVAFARDTILTDWRTAVIAGYTWDSTVQKLGK